VRNRPLRIAQANRIEPHGRGIPNRPRSGTARSDREGGRFATFGFRGFRKSGKAAARVHRAGQRSRGLPRYRGEHTSRRGGCQGQSMRSNQLWSGGCRRGGRLNACMRGLGDDARGARKQIPFAGTFVDETASVAWRGHVGSVNGAVAIGTAVRQGQASAWNEASWPRPPFPAKPGGFAAPCRCTYLLFCTEARSVGPRINTGQTQEL